MLLPGEVYDPLPAPSEQDHRYLASPEQCETNLVAFMAGFTAFRQKKVANGCADCLLTMTVFREETGPDCAFSRTKEIYNGYTYASPELKNLVSSCEKATRDSLAAHDINGDLFKTTLKYLTLDLDNSYVGCIQNKADVTKRLIKFYLTMRMFFAIDNKNLEFKNSKTTSKALVKKSRLL